MQSHHSVIECLFASLKLFQILQGGQCDSIVTNKKELDVAMALQNLITRSCLGLMGGIPKRALFAPNSHIITKNNDNIFNPPKQRSIDDDDIPVHLKAFHEDLKSHGGELFNALEILGEDQLFTTRHEKRGQNLKDGGNVLQVGVYSNGLREWTVRFHVGAYMRSGGYNCYLKFQIGTNKFDSMCECTGGYEENMLFFVIYTFITPLIDFRENHCSHICAGMRMLLDWIQHPETIYLVRILSL